MPQIAAEGEIDLDGALVLDRLDDAAIRAAFDEGRPVVIRADSEHAVLEALRRPEVSSVVVPPELTDLDVVGLTYD